MSGISEIILFDDSINSKESSSIWILNIRQENQAQHELHTSHVPKVSLDSGLKLTGTTPTHFFNRTSSVHFSADVTSRENKNHAYFFADHTGATQNGYEQTI